MTRSGTSSSRGVSSLSRTSYRPAPSRTTSSGVPTISRAAPGTSRVADSRAATSAQRTSTRTTRSTSSVPSLTRAADSSSRSTRATDSLTRVNDGGPSTRSVISERSTLTSFRGTTTDSFRSSPTGPTEPLPTSTYRTTSYSGSYYYPSYYYPSYYGTGYYGWPYYYSGFSIGFNFGSFYFGWNTGWPYYSYWGYNPYSGIFAAAFLVGHAWHIVPYTSLGWVGYNWGGYCSYWPWGTWRRYHRYHYHGHYFRICRPYWYGYARWYDYHPYGYSYTSLVYDSLYDEGYDDGYGRGYNRGYEDGADDASAYKDDRRRDEIGGKPRPRVPDSEIDKAKADAAEEYRYEMTRGTEAFGNGDFKTATKAYKEAVILNPDSADARYSLAISAFAEGKFAFSAFALRRGVSLDAEAGKIDLARVFGDPVRLQGYRDALNAELADNPEDADLLLLSGYVALRTGDAAAAAERLDRALKAAPQDEAAKALQREAMEALENK
ncbi:MAG: tetratricopeptide repeat protein [Planctomycetes bacterium]|nr:tetratricopeptide repeat protein [Planctomycetota bacterium]